MPIFVIVEKVILTVKFNLKICLRILLKTVDNWKEIRYINKAFEKKVCRGIEQLGSSSGS